MGEEQSQSESQPEVEGNDIVTQVMNDIGKMTPEEKEAKKNELKQKKESGEDMSDYHNTMFEKLIEVSTAVAGGRKRRGKKSRKSRKGKKPRKGKTSRKNKRTKRR